MNLSKIRSLHIIIIGAVVCVIVGVGLFFVLIKPMKATIAQTQAQYDASKQVADQEFSARNERDKAIEEAQKTREDYAYFQRTKMPDIDMTDRGQAMVALWREQSIALGPLLQKWPKRTGVRLRTAISVPSPPVNPNGLPAEIIEIPIGNLEVQGDFSKIISHLKSWNYFNRLVRIDLPNLTGPSPFMVSQYSLTVYIFPKGKPGPQIPLAGQVGGTVAAPGGPTMTMPSAVPPGMTMPGGAAGPSGPTMTMPTQ